jgi:hypothetical protein
VAWCSGPESGAETAALVSKLGSTVLAVFAAAMTTKDRNDGIAFADSI